MNPTRIGSGRGSSFKAVLRRTTGRLCFFTASFLSHSLAQLPSPFLDPPAVLANRSVEVRMHSAEEAFYRLDASANLFDWLPLDVLFSTNGQVRLIDPEAANFPFRFYRARQVEKELRVLGLSRNSGSPGTRVEIQGQFFTSDDPKDNQVTFGGVEAAVLEATLTRLVVQVPENAQSGPVQITSPFGQTTSAGLFLVTLEASGQVSPPAGMRPEDFDVVNTYGAVRLATDQSGSFSIPVRENWATVTLAAPRDTNCAAVLMSVTTSSSEPVLLDAASTAQALVFLHPTLCAGDPLLAKRLLDTISQDAKVGEFAQVITSIYPKCGDPFKDPSFAAAFKAAQRSVAAALVQQPLEGFRNVRQARLESVNASASVYGIDLDFLSVATSQNDPEKELRPGQIRVDPARRFKGFFGATTEEGADNPVDWIVIVQEVDIDREFPGGWKDLALAAQGRGTVVPYRLRPGFLAKRAVPSSLISARFNPIKFLAGKLIEEAAGPKPEEGPVVLPRSNAVYVVRGIGPAFFPVDERDFLLADPVLADAYREAVGLNLVSMAMDAVSFLIDIEKISVAEEKEFVAKLIVEAGKKAPFIRSFEDAQTAALELTFFSFEELSDALAKAGLESIARGPARALPFYEVLDKISGLGQVGERALGFVRTTPVESALVLVGDAFGFEIVNADALGGSPGDDITITIRGACFDQANPHDKVFFGAQLYSAQVTAVTECRPVESNGLTASEQTLTMRVPADLGGLADGAYDLLILAQGRRAQGQFHLVSRPIVTEMAPSLGFAAVDNFLGQPFSGTVISLKGFGFTSSDRFVFPGGPAGLAGGAVAVNIPKGATNGPIQIVHRSATGADQIGFSPPLTILGPPVLEKVEPSNGPISRMVYLTAQNTGPDLSVVRAKFNGVGEQSVEMFGSRLRTVVPFGATTGPLKLITPAGQAEFPFTVDPGRENGSTIRVGGSSVVAIERAVAFAGGKAVPADDEDGAADDAQLGGKLEEGDFVLPDFGPAFPPVQRWHLGTNYADTIVWSGESTNNITLDNSFAFDNIEGGVLLGTLIIEGHDIKVGDPAPLTVRKSKTHGVILRGTNNVLNLRCEDNDGDGLLIDGGKNNSIHILAGGNGRNGVTLANGASGNQLNYETIRGDSPGFVIKTNQGHGILLSGEAALNSIRAVASGNKLDGIRLDGPGVKGNKLIVTADHNAGNGITITNGASQTILGQDFIGGALTNGHNGVVLAGDRGHPQLDAAIGQYEVANAWFTASGNGEYGILISGVVETNGLTQIRAVGGGNGRATLRLDKGTRGLRQISVGSQGGGSGLELDDVSNIKITGATVDSASGNGIVVRNTRQSELYLVASKCSGDGIIFSAARDNQVIAGAMDNHGSGLLVTDSSAANNFYGTHNVGQHLQGNRNGLVIASGSQENLFGEFIVELNLENGIVLQDPGTSANRIGKFPFAFSIYTNGLDGIRIQGGASDNTIGSDGGKRGPVIFRSGGAGIRIAGNGTSKNVVLGCDLSFSTNGAGIIIEDHAERNIVGGFIDQERNIITQNKYGVIVRGGATNNIVHHNVMSGNSAAGILIENAGSILVGGDQDSAANQISGSAAGVQLSGAINCQVKRNSVFSNQEGVLVKDNSTGNVIGPGNFLTGNQTGLHISNAPKNRISANTIAGNANAGVLIESGASDNLVEVNSIQRNAVGVRVDGSLRNRISCNFITASAGLGIELIKGGNREQAAPIITDFSGAGVFGTADAPDRSVVEIFTDPKDEGESGCLAAAFVTHRQFRAALPLKPVQVGTLFQLTATVTDPEGNTSEFGGVISAPNAPISKIAFTSTRDGNPEVYLIDGLLSAGLRLTSNPAEDFSPSLSPSGSSMAFVSSREGNYEIYTVRPQPGSIPLRLMTNSAPDYDPAWAPDSRKLAFVSERDGNPEIYLLSLNLSGNIVTRLTSDPAADLSPAFSPDGSQIVFASNRTGRFELFIMNADGTNPRALTTNLGSATEPAWSPDGQWIAFVADGDGNPEIYAIRPDGSAFKRITSHPAGDRSPAWVGDKIVFASNRDSGFELYLVSLVDPAAIRLTVSAGDNTQPSAGAR